MKKRTSIALNLMSRFFTVFLAASIMGLFSASQFIEAQEVNYWPTAAWRSSSPEEQGMKSSILDQIDKHVAEHFKDTSSALVIRNGFIVFEKYYLGNRDDLRAQYSITKTFISALTGIAIDQGFIASVESDLYPYLPDSISSTISIAAKQIKLVHLLTMTSGFGDNGGAGNGDPLYLQISLQYEISHTPGEVFAYNGNNPELLSLVISQTSGMRASEFANRYLFKPIGIEQATWDEGSDYTVGHSGLRISSRDMARFGYLFLRKGKWNSNQIISERWISESTREQTPIPKQYQTPGIDDAYGYQWWTMWYDGHSAYSAIGYNGQRICVIPDFDLVIVFTGTGGGIDVEHLPIIKDCILASIKTN